MTRQLEGKAEEKAAKRAHTLAMVLDGALVDSLESYGVELLGFSIGYNFGACRLVIRVDTGGDRRVGFVYSDTIVGCFLRAYSQVQNDEMVWQVDQYHK